MSESQPLLLDTEERILTVTINGPAKLPALDRVIIEGLAAIARDARDDPGVAAVIVTAAGDEASVAGADIAEMSDLTPSDARERVKAVLDRRKPAWKDR